MANKIIWKTPIVADWEVPVEHRDKLSFASDAVVFSKELTAPDPEHQALYFDSNVFEYPTPLYMRSAGDIAPGTWAACMLTLLPKYPGDPLWEMLPDTGENRFGAGSAIIMFNPPEVPQDGTVVAFSVAQGSAYAPNWGNLVRAARMELTETKFVRATASELTGANKGVWARLIGPNGLERRNFHNYYATTSSTALVLTPGVYMFLTGVANAYQSGQDYPCTLGVTVSDIPPLVTTVNGSFTTGMRNTSLSQGGGVLAWGTLYRFVAPESRSYTFRMAGNFDTWISLHDPDGNQLAWNDDYGNQVSQVTKALSAGDVVYVSASANVPGTTGDYTLTVTPA